MPRLSWTLGVLLSSTSEPHQRVAVKRGTELRARACSISTESPDSQPLRALLSVLESGPKRVLNHLFDVNLTRISGILRAWVDRGRKRRTCGLFLAECHLAEEIHAAGTARGPGTCLPAAGERCSVPRPCRREHVQGLTAMLAFSPSLCRSGPLVLAVTTCVSSGREV